MAGHLTSGDRIFLAAVSRDRETQLRGVAELAVDLELAAEAAGLEFDAAGALDSLDGTDADDVEQLRADLRADLGRLERGEHTDTDTSEESPEESPDEL